MCVCTSGDALGSEPTLPYLSPELKGDKLLVGANFASAGIGILNDTGTQFVCPQILLQFMSILLSECRYVSDMSVPYTCMYTYL